MYQLSTPGHDFRLHKVRGYSYISPLQGWWAVTSDISELHLRFPRHNSTNLLSQRGCTSLNIQKQHHKAVVLMLLLAPSHCLRKKKKIHLCMVQAPHIIGFGIKQTTIRSIRRQQFIFRTLEPFIQLCRLQSQRL